MRLHLSFLFFLIFTANTVCFGAQCISSDLNNLLKSDSQTVASDSVFLCVVKKSKNQNTNQQPTITGYKVDPFVANTSRHLECLYCNSAKIFQANFALPFIRVVESAADEFQISNPEISSFFQIQFNANSERGSPKFKI